MSRSLAYLCAVLLSVGVSGPPRVAAAPPESSLTENGLPEDAYWDNRISPSLPGVNGWVLALTVFNDELIVAGSFTSAGETPANSIAAWNGSTWSALRSGLHGSNGTPGEVYALAVFNGRLIASGNFLSAGEAPADGIAAWDGTSWSPLGSGLLNLTYVNDLVVFDGKLIAGGGFKNADGTPVSAIAAWDGVSWTSLGSEFTWSGGSYVSALAVFDGALIAGGQFTSAGGTPANNLASWDGSAWSPLGGGMDSFVGSLAVYRDHLVAGGSTVASWDGSSWTTLGQGAPSGTVPLLAYGGMLIAGGFGTPGNSLSSWNGATWSAIDPGPDRWVAALAIYGDRLIAGGDFGAAGAVPARGVASWDGSSWSGLYSAMPGVAGWVGDLTVFDDRLIAGGGFTSAGRIAGHIAAWDGTAWSGLGGGPGADIQSLAVFDGRLIAGGDFTEAGGHPAAHVAAWDGTSWAPLGSGTDLSVVALTTYQGHLIAGSNYFYLDCVAGFGPYCGVEGYMNSWDGEGWSPVGPTLNGAFGHFAVYDDRLIALTTGTIRAWDGSAWVLLYPGSIFGGGTTIHEGLLLVGTEIIRYECPWGCFEVGRQRQILAWDGTSWALFEGDMNGQALALAVYDHKVIAGGNFTTIGGVPANHIAAWDGHGWSPLGSGTDGPVHSLAVYNGSLVVAGDFTSAGGKFSPSLAVWTRLDPRQVALDVMPGSCSNPVHQTPSGRASAVLPVAILGAGDLDVRDIDPASVTLNGARPIRWGYQDVGAPTDLSGEACACPAAGPDGHADLTLAFSRDEVLASLRGQERLEAGKDVVTVEGRFHDGSRFEGADCVTFVGR